MSMGVLPPPFVEFGPMPEGLWAPLPWAPSLETWTCGAFGSLFGGAVDGDHTRGEYGPVSASSSCGAFNCFDGSHIPGHDITCISPIGDEAECAELCCLEAACIGFDFSVSDGGRCCTSDISRADGPFEHNGGSYRSCEKDSVTGVGGPTYSPTVAVPAGAHRLLIRFTYFAIDPRDGDVAWLRTCANADAACDELWSHRFGSSAASSNGTHQCGDVQVAEQHMNVELLDPPLERFVSASGGSGHTLELGFSRLGSDSAGANAGANVGAHASRWGSNFFEVWYDSAAAPPPAAPPLSPPSDEQDHTAVIIGVSAVAGALLVGCCAGITYLWSRSVRKLNRSREHSTTAHPTPPTAHPTPPTAHHNTPPTAHHTPLTAHPTPPIQPPPAPEAPAPLTCGACAQLNRPDSRYCVACGGMLRAPVRATAHVLGLDDDAQSSIRGAVAPVPAMPVETAMNIPIAMSVDPARPAVQVSASTTRESNARSSADSLSVAGPSTSSAGSATPSDSMAACFHRPTTDTKIGITLVGDSGSPEVTAVAPDGVATSVIFVGDIVLSINGVLTSSGQAGAVEQLKACVGDIEMLVRRAPPPVVVRVHRPTRATKIGLTLGGSSVHPVVSLIAPDGVATGTGLCVGDTLLSINGTPSNNGWSHAVEQLQGCVGDIELVVRHGAQAPTIHRTTPSAHKKQDAELAEALRISAVAAREAEEAAAKAVADAAAAREAEEAAAKAVVETAAAAAVAAAAAAREAQVTAAKATAEAAAAREAEEAAAKVAAEAVEAGESEEVARRYASMVEAEKERLREERKRDRLDKLRQRSASFVTPSVPATSFSNVRDVTRGQASSRNSQAHSQLPAPLVGSSLQLNLTQFVQSAIELISPRGHQPAQQPEAEEGTPAAGLNQMV